LAERVHDVIVIGSGAAGVFAAHALQGTDTCVVDVGYGPTETSLPDQGLHALRAARPMLRELIGESFESLHNITGADLSPKLKAPFMRFVTRAPQDGAIVHSASFRPVLSHAEGGLANAWGAQVYRFDDEDLRGFPLRASELEAYYDRATDIVGISGSADDLAEMHRSAYGLLPPLELAPAAQALLSAYEARRASFHARGIRIGRPRLAVLSRERDARSAMDYRNLEFFWPRIPAVYSPAYTLRALLADGKIRYVPGHRVRRFAETADGVDVEATQLATDKPVTFRARHLVLALGALNTPRLVLHSAGDTVARLPVVENPVSFAPLIGLRLLGQPIATSAYSSQLNFSYQGALHPSTVIGMLYGVDGLLRSDILFKFPLALRGCLAASRLVLPATLLLQVFYSGEPRPENRLGVDAQGNLLVDHAAHLPGGVERHLLSAFRRLGFYGFTRTTRVLEPGGSIHYGGALPMHERSGAPYETDRDGRLGGSRRVFVADSSTFPRLPAKNLTFTIMANALRVGDAVRRQLEVGP